MTKKKVSPHIGLTWNEAITYKSQGNYLTKCYHLCAYRPGKVSCRDKIFSKLLGQTIFRIGQNIHILVNMFGKLLICTSQNVTVDFVFDERSQPYSLEGAQLPLQGTKSPLHCTF